VSDWGDRYDPGDLTAVDPTLDHDHDHDHDGQGTADDQDLAPEETPPLYYGSVDEFVRLYLRLVYRRRIDGTHRRWAARWWQHEEAIIRLEALWRAWEHLRLDPATGMSIWWRDHADHHMPALMNPDGPFAAISQSDPVNHSGPADPLPYIDPPEGLFPDERELDSAHT